MGAGGVMVKGEYWSARKSENGWGRCRLFLGLDHYRLMMMMMPNWPCVLLP